MVGEFSAIFFHRLFESEAFEKSSLLFRLFPPRELVLAPRRFLLLPFLDTVLKGSLALPLLFPLKFRADRRSVMKPEEHVHSFKKVSSTDYQAQMDLALSSQNENVREAIETSYSPLGERKS
jgi:hypothetical protein